MTAASNTRASGGFKARLLAACSGIADNAVLPLVSASLALGWVAWRLFFHFALWLWARQFHLDMATVNTWAYSAFTTEADGAEPQALFALAVASTVLLAALAHVLRRASRRVRVVVTLVSACGALCLLHRAHFVIPLTSSSPVPLEISAANAHYLAVVVSAVGVSILLSWGLRTRRLLSVITAVLLVPVAFLPSAPPSPGDAMAILSPALRLLHGAAPAHVYMQYDYLPSLIAEAWLWLGGDPMAIFFGAALSCYVLLCALVPLARRWFSHPGLAGPLLVAVVLVRIYGVEGDQMAVPQVAPFRLDLWILPVAVALYFGVRHWAVAVTLGLLCITLRSMGVLYLAGYAMAYPADFLAARLALNKADRPSLRQEWRALWRAAAPNAAIIVGSLALTTWLLGSPVSEAALLYRKLGVGQMRVASDSFYWWLLPLTALSGALAFWKRAELGEKRGGAMLLTVALLICGSVYFFGRSHENNLINLSVPFLLCFFLCLDIFLSDLAYGPRAALALQVVASSALIGVCAFRYSGRIWTKAATQIALVSRDEQAASMAIGHFPPMYCEEVAQQVPDKKVYFFGTLDYWYYQRCNYDPPSYEQPVGLSILRAPLAAELAELLDNGYTIALVKTDVLTSCFSEDFAPNLAAQHTLVTAESAHYSFVSRGEDAQKPARRRRRPARATP